MPVLKTTQKIDNQIKVTTRTASREMTVQMLEELFIFEKAQGIVNGLIAVLEVLAQERLRVISILTALLCEFVRDPLQGAVLW